MVLCKAKKNIFYKKKRGEEYRSFSLERCLADMEKFHLWPDTVNGDGVRASLHRDGRLTITVGQDTPTGSPGIWVG